MDYYTSRSKVPFYNMYNSKFQKKFEINKSNNNNLMNNKNIKPFIKEILSGDKKSIKKYKTTKNSPNKDNIDILLYKDYSNENKRIKINQNNDIMQNGRISNNEMINDFFINKMKRTYKKALQNPLSNRPNYNNSNSLLVSNSNITDFINRKLENISNDNRFESSMNNSRLIKILKNKNTNNIDSNQNSFFYYNNNNLFKYYNKCLEEKEKKNYNNNLYNNINKSELDNINKNHLNPSNSMKMILSNNPNNNLLNKYYYNINNYNHNRNNHISNENIDIENLLDNENELTYSRRRIIGNCNIIKNGESKLMKNHLNKNNNFKINHNNNFKSNNKIYSHHRIKSNEIQNNNK